MRSLSAVTFTLILAAGAGLAAASGPDPDERAVRRHIERTYFDGVRRSDTGLAHKAFHPVVTMYSVRDGKFTPRSIPDWLAAIAERAPRPPAPDSHPRRVVSVDVSGNAAMAKLELEYPDARIVDYMSLLKIDGEWIIVGKIFDRQPGPAQATGRQR